MLQVFSCNSKYIKLMRNDYCLLCIKVFNKPLIDHYYKPPLLISTLSSFLFYFLAPFVISIPQSFPPTGVMSAHRTVCVCAFCVCVHGLSGSLDAQWQSISIWATAQHHYRGILRITLGGQCVSVCG